MSAEKRNKEGRFNLSDWALRQQSLIVFLMLITVVLGTWSYLRLSRNEDPPFTIKTMVVQAQWPGATQEDTLLQVTERCDLRCAHCFVSATRRGADMRLGDLATALPRLESARVSTVTLTGGEPFVHPDLLELVTLLTGTGVAVTICTNGVSVTTDQIAALRRLPGTSVNVSLDGFSRNSHGRFRGDRDSFDVTVANIRRLGDAGLLKGILCTPNALADPSEFAAIYLFGEEAGAEYVLLNPLSSFGRGIRTRERLRADETEMRRIRHDIEQANQARHGPEPVFIRFPNDSKPLSGCIAGEVVYVFVNGDTAV